MSFRSQCRRSILWTALFLGLAGTASAETVTVQWNANTEVGIIGYTVAYGTRSGVYTTTVPAGNVTSYPLTLTTPGTYYVAVSATSAGGTSNYSAEVSTVITGAPVSQMAVLIDSPSAGQVVNSDVFLTGWAADLGSPAGGGPGVDAIHVYAYPNPGSGTAPILLGAVSYGTARPDVAGVYGSQFTNSGYSMTIVGLAPGRYDLALFGHSTLTNTFSIQRNVPITVGAPTAPGARVYVDTPRTGDGIPGALTVAGWAVDQRSTSGPGVNAVNVWAYPQPGSGAMPIFLGAASFGGDRADVGALFGSRYRFSGFTMTIVSLTAGLYDIVAIPRSTISGGFENARVVRVTVQPSVVVAVDGPPSGGTVNRSFSISGWSLDRRASANNGIDAINVWAFPIQSSGAWGNAVWMGATVTGFSRPDVGAAFGSQYSASGYGLTVTAPAAGVYDLVVFAQSKATGQFENATVVRVTVR